MNISYSCPKCGKHLVYDGMLVWRSGPRPPRSLASKKVGFSPRADYERERIYHCDHCGAEFYADVEQRHHHLYEEGVRGQYTYNAFNQSWELQSPGRTGGKKKARQPTKVRRRPKPQIPRVVSRRRRAQSRPRRKRNETLELVLFVGGAAVVVVGVTVLLLRSLGTGREAIARGSILGAGVGLLAATLNGPRSRSREENPSMRTLLGRILLLALALVPAGAASGALVGLIYGGSDSGSMAMRVLGHAVGGSLVGGVATILTVQAGIAIATAIGRVLYGAWKRVLLLEMADSAADLILHEGGIALVLPGLCIGALAGVVLALAS